MQVLAQSALLKDCTALRWKADCSWLAVVGAETTVLHPCHLSVATSISFSNMPTDCTMDCAWVPGTGLLAVWAQRGRCLNGFVVASAPEWSPSTPIGLPGPLAVSRPQWGFQRLAATSADTGSLLIYALSLSSSGGSAQLLATLPEALHVARSDKLWPGLTSYAWSPEVRFPSCDDSLASDCAGSRHCCLIMALAEHACSVKLFAGSPLDCTHSCCCA